MSAIELAADQNGAKSCAASLMRNLSLEATFPAEREVEELCGVLPLASPIFLSAPPGRPHSKLVEAAVRVRRAGFEPVPHIAARNFHSIDTLRDFIARLSGEAKTQRVMIIAGDVDMPAGPFDGAIGVIESDLLQTYGIKDIGIAGYPDGHPKLNDATVARALSEKLKSAEARSLQVEIVTQFCFDPDRILTWLRRLQDAGIRTPVRLGIVGPTNVTGLVRFALRCGVRNSVKFESARRAAHLFTDVVPDEFISHLGGALSLNSAQRVSMHVYSFGGLVRTARWAQGYRNKLSDEKQHLPHSRRDLPESLT